MYFKGMGDRLKGIVIRLLIFFVSDLKIIVDFMQNTRQILLNTKKECKRFRLPV